MAKISNWSSDSEQSLDQYSVDDQLTFWNLTLLIVICDRDPINLCPTVVHPEYPTTWIPNVSHDLTRGRSRVTDHDLKSKIYQNYGWVKYHHSRELGRVLGLGWITQIIILWVSNTSEKIDHAIFQKSCTLHNYSIDRPSSLFILLVAQASAAAHWYIYYTKLY